MFRSRSRAQSLFDLEPEAAVRIAYQTILGREPDPPGAAAWVTSLVDGGVDRLGVCEALITSTEFSDRYRRFGAPQAVSDTGSPLVARMNNGTRLHLAPGDRLISEVIAATGVWEPHVTALLDDLLRPGDLFVDVGANVGYFTLLAASAVGPEGRVIAFEPAPRNVQLLLWTVVTNQCRNVEVWPVALGSSRDTMAIAVDSKTTNASLAAAPTGTWAVTVTGDELMGDLPPFRASVVKIDVEGFEHAALCGMRRFLTTHRPTVVLEFHPHLIEVSGQDVQAELDFLFTNFASIEVISGEGELTSMSSPDDVLGEWRRVNQLAHTGEALHLDLVARSVLQAPIP